MPLDSIKFLSAVMLVPALIGALWLIIVILYKGDICPGQRGRLHKSIAIVGGLFLVATVNNLWFLPSVALIGWFFSKVQTKKTRIEGPRAALVGAAIWASLVGCLGFNQQLTQYFLWESVVGFAYFLVLVLLLGASLAHLLLLRARTRLQAFHRILPVTAIVASFGYLIVWVVLFWAGLDRASLSSEEAIMPLLAAIAALLIALLVWNWHLLQRREIKQASLWFAVIGVSSAHSVFMHLLP